MATDLRAAWRLPPRGSLLVGRASLLPVRPDIL